MQELWQSFQLGWELFQHLNAPPAQMLFNPLLGSIGSRLKLLNLQLDFTSIDQMKSLSPPEIVSHIPELKAFLGNQLLALSGTPSVLAFSLGFDLGLLCVVHANIRLGLEEKVPQLQEKLEQELDSLDISPKLLHPVLDRLADREFPDEEFLGLVIRSANDLAFPLANPRGRERIFIAMPFDEVHLPTLDTIRTAARYAGFYAWRADDQAYSGTSIPDVYLKGIDEAALVIADLSGNTQNVYFEAGYALRQGKQPLYIAQKGTPVQFDVNHYPVLFFEDQADLEERLTSALKKRVAATSTERVPA